MDELKDARLYGGIGAILSSFGFFVPYLGILVSIVGFVLEILAIDKTSRALNDREIFKNYLISLVLVVVGAVFAIFLGILVFGVALIGWMTKPMQSLERGGIGSIISLLAAAFIILLILWIVFIVSAIFLRKSFDSIAKKLNVPLFNTAGLLYLIGAATTIIIIGFLITFVADILKIIAYFSIPESITSPPTQPPPQTQTA